MKRFCLSLAALLTAIGLAAAPASAGKKDDTLVWATDRDNPIADPFYLNTRELVVIGHHVWDTLVIIDPKTAEIKPLLATKWTWVNPTTLEMELRKGVKFHSGKEMDADDVVYTLNHAANKDNAIANFALLAWIKSAEKIDADKIRINLNRPFPPALAYLAGLGFIMQKGHYDNAPVKPDGKKDFGAVKPNGTGPYKITEVKPGEHILMEKNADYFKDGFKGDPEDLQDPLPHHQGHQHAHRRADDRRHRLDLGRAQGPGRAHPGQPGDRRGECQDAARLLSAIRRARRLGPEVLHRQARAPGRGARHRSRGDHQEPGRSGVRGRAQPLPSRPVRLLERRAQVRLRSRQGQGAAEGGGLSPTASSSTSTPIATASTPKR